jgi:hypothetical protein
VEREDQPIHEAEITDHGQDDVREPATTQASIASVNHRRKRVNFPQHVQQSSSKDAINDLRIER